LASISPRIPLERDTQDGYTMNSELQDVFKQNLKNLLLTCPGERMMDPLFGVGIRNYLFEQNSFATQENIRSKITQQVDKYMPFVSLLSVDLAYDETDLMLIITINYHIPGINITDMLTIENSTIRNTQFQTI